MPAQRPKERWPEYALDVLEETVYMCKEGDSKLRSIQEAAIQKHYYTVIMLASDMRVMLIEIKSKLHQARSGHYIETEERTP